MTKYTHRYLEKQNRNYYKTQITNRAFEPLFLLYSVTEYKTNIFRTIPFGNILAATFYNEVIYSLFKPDELLV